MCNKHCTDNPDKACLICLLIVGIIGIIGFLIPGILFQIEHNNNYLIGSCQITEQYKEVGNCEYQYQGALFPGSRWIYTANFTSKDNTCNNYTATFKYLCDSEPPIFIETLKRAHETNQSITCYINNTQCNNNSDNTFIPFTTHKKSIANLMWIFLSILALCTFGISICLLFGLYDY